MSLWNVPVLCYHGVSDQDMSPQLFESHLQTLKSMGFRTISGQDLFLVVTGARRPGFREVVLTFDDCHLNNWLTAIPLLAEYGFRAVFFAVTDFIQPGESRTKANSPEFLKASDSFRAAIRDGNCEQFMNESEIRSTIHDYGMEVYAHSSSHRPCFCRMEDQGVLHPGSHWGCLGVYGSRWEPGLPEFKIGSAYAFNGYWPVFDGGKLRFRLRTEQSRYEETLDDFRRSLNRIQDVNGLDRQLFCWPWGQFDPVSEMALQEAGFVGAFTLERLPNAFGTSPFRLSRIGVAKDRSSSWLRARLRMHGTVLSSRLFCKRYHHRP
ncbi:MAG: hypothetical protein EOM25_07380 [Deltaproteobacteria bacterium]|nr:hypothetical protein [Deltaproteobacteria bacterium]